MLALHWPGVKCYVIIIKHGGLWQESPLFAGILLIVLVEQTNTHTHTHTLQDIFPGHPGVVAVSQIVHHNVSYFTYEMTNIV